MIDDTKTLIVVTKELRKWLKTYKKQHRLNSYDDAIRIIISLANLPEDTKKLGVPEKKPEVLDQEIKAQEPENTEDDTTIELV